MKTSKELLREIEFELSNQRSKSPLRDSGIPRIPECSKSELLADKILEKIRADKERFSIECRKIKTQIMQVLQEDSKKHFYE
jgi:hypothetical protein